MGKFKKIPAKTSAVKAPSVLKTGLKFKTSKELKTKGIHRVTKLKSQTSEISGVNEFADFSLKQSSEKLFKPQSNKKPGKGKVKRLTKKERQQFRKEQILERIQATQNAFIEDKAREKREKTEIIKDVKPLLDALPSLGSIFQFKSDRLKTGVPAYDKPIGKAQAKQDRREQKTKEFQEKLTLHKTLVQNLTALPAEKRRQAIREAVLKRKTQQGNEVMGGEMQE